MKIVMRTQISGTRDGVDWPAPGQTIDLPDDEAVDLLNAGYASPVEADGPETAAAPKARRGKGAPTDEA